MSETLVEIYDVDNPTWAALDPAFVAMVHKFAEEDLANIPSMTAETLHQYICNIVDTIHHQKLMRVHDDVIQYRLQIGFVDKELKGFQLFHMLGNRLPHIMTLNWAYIYSESPKLSYKFSLEVQKYMKKWKAHFLTQTIANKRLARVMKKLFKNCSQGGVYFVATGVNSELIKC